MFPFKTPRMWACVAMWSVYSEENLRKEKHTYTNWGIIFPLQAHFSAKAEICMYGLVPSNKRTLVL